MTDSVGRVRCSVTQPLGDIDACQQRLCDYAPKSELVRIEIGLDETFDAEEGRSDSVCLVRTQDDRAVRESIHTGQPKAASAVSRQQRTRIHLIAGWCSVPFAQVPFCEERQLSILNGSRDQALGHLEVHRRRHAFPAPELGTYALPARRPTHLHVALRVPFHPCHETV